MTYLKEANSNLLINTIKNKKDFQKYFFRINESKEYYSANLTVASRNLQINTILGMWNVHN